MTLEKMLWKYLVYFQACDIKDTNSENLSMIYKQHYYSVETVTVSWHSMDDIGQSFSASFMGQFNQSQGTKGNEINEA